MMKEEFLDSYNGYHIGFPMDPMEPPSLYLASGRRPQRRRRHLRTAQAGALIRHLGLVGPPEVATLNRRGSPWVGNDPKSRKSGALIRRLGLVIDPKQARGIRRLGQEMALNSGARNSLPWV